MSLGPDAMKRAAFAESKRTVPLGSTPTDIAKHAMKIYNEMRTAAELTARAHALNASSAVAGAEAKAGADGDAFDAGAEPKANAGAGGNAAKAGAEAGAEAGSVGDASRADAQPAATSEAGSKAGATGAVYETPPAKIRRNARPVSAGRAAKSATALTPGDAKAVPGAVDGASNAKAEPTPSGKPPTRRMSTKGPAGGAKAKASAAEPAGKTNAKARVAAKAGKAPAKAGKKAAKAGGEPVPAKAGGAPAKAGGEPTKAGGEPALAKAGGEPAPAEAGGALATSANFAAPGYVISEELRGIIAMASTAGDIPVDDRKKCYMAIGRREKTMPPGVLARWTGEKGAYGDRFTFLKEWAAGGGSWGNVTVTERHETIAETAAKDTYRWVTLPALLTEYDAWDHPKKREYVERLIKDAITSKKAKGKHKGDDDYTLHKILLTQEETKKKANRNSTDVALDAVPEDSSASAVLDVAKSFKMAINDGPSDDDDKADKNKKPKPKPVPVDPNKPVAVVDPNKKMIAEAEQWRKRCNSDAAKVRKALSGLSVDSKRNHLVIAALDPFREQLAEFAGQFEDAYIKSDFKAVPEIQKKCKQLLWDVKTQLQAANSSLKASTKDPLLAPSTQPTPA